MNHNWINRAFGLIFLGLMLSSCGENNPLDIDVSHVKADVRIERMEQELFSADFNELPALNAKYRNQYGELWDVYLMVMLRAGSPEDSLITVYLDRFTHDPIMTQVYQDISSQYKDLGWLKEDLDEAFRHLKYYYPDAKEPVVVTFNSAFNYGVSTFEKHIGLGLDMYLGPDNRVVKQIPTEEIPQFIKDKMIRDYMVVDIMRGWFETNFMAELEESDFLSRIIYEGKILYALDALLPKTADHLKIRYTPDQYGWCLKHETEIWKDIVDHKLLYTDDPLEIKKFCDEAPFTSGLPQNSPGRVGAFLGWRMVRSYMSANPELQLPQLINEKNPKKILKFYEPE